MISYIFVYFLIFSTLVAPPLTPPLFSELRLGRSKDQGRLQGQGQGNFQGQGRLPGATCAPGCCQQAGSRQKQVTR